MTRKQRKVWILGLDGATFDLIAPWAADGSLPVLGRLMQQGTWGELESTYPPLTAPAWSSFMTGKSPARHGVLEFFRRQEGTYRQVLNSYRDVDGPSLWRILSDAGHQVGVMGVPLTYPPEALNGFMISGLLTPAGRRDFTYPFSLLEELETHLGVYRLRHDEVYRRNNPGPFLREQHEILENNTQAALYLMRHKPWDLFMLHFLGTDRMQHEFWHLIDPEHPQHDPAEHRCYGNVILDFYQRVDHAVGRLLGALEKDTVVLIMSDHGLGSAHKFINVNTWLLQEGLLHLKRTPLTGLRRILFRSGMNYSIAAQWILKLGLGRRAKQAGRARREEFQRRLFLSLDDVDWSRTQVYSMGNFGQLFVNLKGREPQGIVAPGFDCEQLLDDLARRLQALVDPDTGQAVIERVFRREQVYDGPYAASAPDLMFLTQDMSYKAMGLSDFSSPRVFDPIYGTTGHHRMNGVMIWNGPGVIREGEQYRGARIHDLAPTLLYMAGLPIPREMDGRVLLDLFEPEFREQHPVTYTTTDAGSYTGSGGVYTEQEEAEQREMLRALGYVT